MCLVCERLWVISLWAIHPLWARVQVTVQVVSLSWVEILALGSVGSKSRLYCTCRRRRPTSSLARTKTLSPCFIHASRRGATQDSVNALPTVGRDSGETHLTRTWTFHFTALFQFSDFTTEQHQHITSRSLTSCPATDAPHKSITKR